MHKKLGPLEAWQWGAILAALAGIYLLYEHEKNNVAASSTTSTDSGMGAIDPTTGIPYADELSAGGGYSGGGGGIGDTTGADSTDSGTSLDQELSDLGAIEGLMSGLPGFGATGAGNGGSSGLPTDQLNTLNGDLTTLNKTLGRQQTALSKLQKAVSRTTAPRPKTAPKPKPKKTVTHGGTKNPGHTITHVGGTRIASSSAPHNARQHTNVSPPHHQKAPARPRPKKKAKR